MVPGSAVVNLAVRMWNGWEKRQDTNDPIDVERLAWKWCVGDASFLVKYPTSKALTMDLETMKRLGV